MEKIVFTILIILCGLFPFALFIDYNNMESCLRKQAATQQEKIEENYDIMWKIVSEQTHISSNYKNIFNEIYPEIISRHYVQDDLILKNWIIKYNPNFDISLYNHLVEAIEKQLIIFSKDQIEMHNIIYKHNMLCRTYPWFIKNRSLI